MSEYPDDVMLVASELATYYCGDNLRESKRAIARAIMAERERQWQPIETAPKDGTGIFVSFSGFNGLHSFTALAWYSESEEGWRAMSEHGYGPMSTVEPNLWMPLPAPPKGEPR